MSPIRHLWQRHRIVVLIFAAACAISLFFLIRLASFALYWNDPAHRNLSPEPWMTPGYVAHSWGLDPQELSDQLGVAPGERPTLADLARARDVPVSDILEQVQTLLTPTFNQ